MQAGLGQRVYELRNAMEYDQLALARMAGYKNANVISDMEKGKYNPTLKRLHDLAKALHTSNLISALKDGAFHTTPNRAGACTQPGYNGSSTHLPCQRSRGASVEGALAPTNSVPSLMYPVQGRYGCCCSLAATFFPPRPEGRGLSKGFGEAYLLTWHHTALDLATLKRLLDAELSEMTVYNAEMSKRLHIILALIARCG
jgi:DNA-binding XRE family transcriptional regulator